jgi:SAM-dependent methyltransferase
MNCKICSQVVNKYTNNHLNMLVPNGFPLTGELALNVCNGCQFVSNQSSATETDYVEYYTRLNKHQVRVGDLSIIDKDYFSELVAFIADNSNFNFLNANVLDFGSGALLFSEIAKEAGADLALNLDVGLSTIHDVAYDLVVSTHTFEHLLDPAKVFEDLLKLLNHDGHIVIAVPDFSNYNNAYYGPYGHFDLEHINHFSVHALVALYERYQVEVIAVRKGERRVSPTLAYSEVLLIGKRIAGVPIRRLELANFSAKNELQSLVERYETDFKITLKAFNNIVEEARSVGKSQIAIYGLSSYAFRLLHGLKEINQLGEVDFYGDSDSRLSDYDFEGNPILQKNEFYGYIKDAIDLGFTVYVVVFAINSYRIVEMFNQECMLDGMKVIALPPNSQNRKDLK